jgi:proline iminopeptidase
VRLARHVAVFSLACVAPLSALLANAASTPKQAARELRIPVGKASLYAREIGRGRPIIVLHGGPDFDISYLLPEMDRLADGYRLIYYDQRGRGKSADGVEPEDVGLESELHDLDTVRRHLGLERTALLGHSWGTVLALEYALRHPDRVSQLVLMNPAPASKDDFQLLLRERGERWPDAVEQLRAMRATAAYREADPDAVAAYYRVHFKAALERPEDLDRLIARMRASFTRQGVLKARAVEDRLMQDTWSSGSYDLFPRLRGLAIPTLVLYGDHDFIPEACAVHIAQAIPKARYVALKACGHFSFMECPDAVRAEVDSLFGPVATPARAR